MKNLLIAVVGAAVLCFLGSCASGPETPEAGTAEPGPEETAEAEPEAIEVRPVGSGELSAEHPLGHGPCTEDVMNVQNAVLKAAQTGGKVMLKTDGDTTFNFGTFVPQTGEEWLRHGVHLFTGVTIEGEKNSEGTQATIENGYMVMRGINLQGRGKLEIKGIHFRNFGATAVYLEGVAKNVSVEIRDNKITADYYERFSGTEALDRYINTDDPKLVDGPLSPQKDPGTFMKAIAKLMLNPALDFQEQGGGVYPVQEWWSMAVNSQMVLGDVLIENNYIDLEEGSDLPADDTHVWWHTMGLIYGNVHGSITNRGNTIKNVTSTASGGIILSGERIDRNNQVVLGPLASYEFEKPASREVAAGHLSVVGICARNCICTLEGKPQKAGKVTFQDNVVICKRDKDALPLGILGGSGHSFNSVKIVNNAVTLENGSTGITVQDVENASIARNTISGKARYGIRIGSTEKVFPINTDGNIFENNDMSGLSVSAAHVYFDSDAHGNKVVGGGGTFIDRGEGNALDGDYSTVDDE